MPPLLRAIALNHVQTTKALLIGGASLQSVHPETNMTAIQVWYMDVFASTFAHHPLTTQIATSDVMRELLSDPPDVSPWNSTGLLKPPQSKARQKAKSSAAWSSKRVKINHAAVLADGGSAVSEAPKLTEEEMEAALRAARAEARAKRRAAVEAEANLGLNMDDVLVANDGDAKQSGGYTFHAICTPLISYGDALPSATARPRQGGRRPHGVDDSG